MKVIDLKKEDKTKVIQEAIKALSAGKLIVYPTETCYGAGVDATNSKAAERLFKFKGERKGKPISVAVADEKMAESYVEINQIAENLYKNLLPGPLTVVSQSKGKVVPWLESPTQTLGIRIPNYPFTLKIIRKFGKPITATSANSSGKKPPYSLDDLQKYTAKKSLELVSLFLDAGQLPPRSPSTVVDTTLNEPAILRQGEIVIPEIPGQTFISNSEQQTKKIARKIFSEVEPRLARQSLIFALQGELGSGKTQFVKGLAKALGIKSNVTSPTFILMREYSYHSESASGILFHIDTWRMERGEEILELGLEKMFKPGNIIAIEWLQKVRQILEGISKKNKICLVWITIKTISKNKRKIKYTTSV